MTSLCHYCKKERDGKWALMFSEPDADAEIALLREALMPFANPPKTSYGARIINESCYKKAQEALSHTSTTAKKCHKYHVCPDCFKAVVSSDVAKFMVRHQ